MGQVGNGLVKKLDWVLVWFKFWIDYWFGLNCGESIGFIKIVDGVVVWFKLWIGYFYFYLLVTTVIRLTILLLLGVHKDHFEKCYTNI